VTIEHAFGETVVDEEPTRVVTWGWGSADAAIALGGVPVAMPYEEYGGDEEGVLPWVRQALEEDGTTLPEVLPNAEEPPFEAIAAARPDLILAVYSGITESDYQLLSAIAPTVAYPDEPWATPWRDTIEIVGTALGKPDTAEQLLDDIDAAVAEQASAHPELEGKTVANVWPASDAFYVYRPTDARVAFTLDLGLASAPSVDELANGDQSFFYTISEEQVPDLTSDILVSYADTQSEAVAFLSSPTAKLMDQVERGTVAQVVGSEFIAAVSPPTALSLTWGLDEYVSLLSDAAQAADTSG
jgi:iron complex transport system substrate-binding protein